MNIHKVRDLLREVEAAPLERLNSKEIVDLGKMLEKALESCTRKADFDFRMNSFLNSIPTQYEDYYKKKSKVKKLSDTASPAAMEKHLQQRQETWQKIKREIEERRALLKRLRQSDSAGGLAIINGLSAEELADICLLANLTRPNKAGKEIAFKITKSAKNNLEWLEKLKDSRTKTILD